MELDKVIEKIRRYCAMKERCSSEITARLRRYEPDIKDTEIEDILYQLKESNFWDEQRFTRAFVHDKHTFHSWGPLKIQHALKEKNVDEKYIHNAMSNVEQDQYFQALEKLLQKKFSLSNYSDAMEARIKLSRYAQNKGYTYDMINDVLSRILQH